MAHFILRCKRCKTTQRISAEKVSKTAWRLPDGQTRRGGGSMGDWLSLPCPTVACQGKSSLLGRKVQGCITAQACNAKCVSAVGHICECSCGGEQHGAAHT